MKARKEVSNRAAFERLLIGTLVAGWLAVTYTGCGGKKMDGSDKQQGDRKITKAQWEKVAGMKIFFGHRSVGKNILAGIGDLMEEEGAGKVEIVETTDPEGFQGGVFAHMGVGKNSEPETKLQAFEEILGNGVGERVDVAMLKFCFVDVRQNTDVNALFASYKQTFDRLQKKFPEVTFVHLTLPVTQLRTTLKTHIKKALGFEKIWEFDNLAAKNEYNERIRKEHGRTEAFLDVAAAESTRPDGTKETFEWNDKTYEALVPAYTDDGGHLNEVGRKVVAAEMLRVLARQK